MNNISMASITKQNVVFLKIGILGSIISVVADLFLGYFPSGIYGFETPFTISIDKVYTVLAQANHTRLLFSNYCSAIGIPLGWFGIYFIYKYLRIQKQKILSLTIVALGTVGYASGTFFHLSLSYIATLYRLEGSTAAINYFEDFSQPFAYIFLCAIFIVSLLLTYTVLLKKIQISKWMAFFTPFFIELIIGALSFVVPITVKTFLIISIYNMSLLIFYSLFFVAFTLKVKANEN